MAAIGFYESNHIFLLENLWQFWSKNDTRTESFFNFKAYYIWFQVKQILNCTYNRNGVVSLIKVHI